jgi:hypothetical protein
MKGLLLSILLYPFLFTEAQKTLPGGVKDVLIWQATENDLSNASSWKSKLDNKIDSSLNLSGKLKSINSNPALYISPGTLNHAVNLGKISSFSMFTVCQETDSVTEKVLFSLENDTTTETVITDKRFAALDVYRYANYNRPYNLIPKIYSYSQNKAKDSLIIARRLQLGRVSKIQNIPVSSFSGIIPEFILFKRCISFTERQKVESYLALKYGISINQKYPVSYLNSRGEIIWDADLHNTHNQNIAGIGRDNTSGLYQKVSESVQTLGVLKIGLLHEIIDNSFIIWGDNGKTLRFEDGVGIRRLLRDWEISPFNAQGDSVFVETNILAINEIDPLRENENLWLMVDKSGSGEYPFMQTDYIKSRPMDSKRGIAHFNKFVIDNDFSGSDKFTLLAAPSFFTRSTVLAPSCLTTQSGKIETEIIGGKPPYTLLLNGVTNPSLSVMNKEITSYHIMEGLEQGSYKLTITDSQEQSFMEDIWIANSRLWENNLEKSYKLSEGQLLNLDASQGMPSANYVYSWACPDGTAFYNEKIAIDKPGTYILSVTDENNCNSSIKIQVNQAAISRFKKVEIFPNPTHGWFSVRIDLSENTNVNVTIADFSGKILNEFLLKNDCYYWFNYKINKPGIYFIGLASETEKQTLKLVVQ